MNINIYKEQSYRNDIQGVRALGATLIMIYHIWLGKVSGGVDVFFVVSGYFMAGMLIRSYLTNKKIKPFEFWGKIIKRVAPLAYIVIASTLVLGYFFMPPNLWLGGISESLTSALNIENLQLIRVGTDYIASNNPPSPFQQFWALSIQIQFYLFLPFIFMVGINLSNRVKSYKALLAIIITIIVLSFCFSIYYTNINPSEAYFNTASRAWEFFVGVAVFMVLPLINITGKTARVLRWIGFLLILTIGIVAPRDISYPGYIALAPVFAAACMIIAGAFDQTGYLYKLLSSKPFVYIGNRSFSIYLWHWPILIFFQYYTGTRPSDISFIEGLGIIALALIIAIVSKRLIEDPFVKIKKTSSMAPYFIGFLFFVPVTSSSFYIRSQVVNTYEKDPATNYVNSKYYEGSNAYIETGPTNIGVKDFISVESNRSIPSLTGCIDGVVDGMISFCELGDKNSENVILLIGGSRLAHWEPLFSYMAKKENFKIVAATINSCSFGFNPLQDPKCEDWNNKVIKFIADMNPKPKAVIVNSSRSEHKGTVKKFGIKSGEYMPSGYVNNIKEVTSMGIPVIGIRINPVADDPNVCVWGHMKDASKCTIHYQTSLLEKNPALALKEEVKDFYPVDFTSVICSDGLCPLTFDGYLTMIDDSHFTASYISYLAPALEKSLNDQVGGFSKFLNQSK